MKRIKNTTPGEILLEEFLQPMKITAYKLAKDTKIPVARINAIVKGKRKITVDTALRLSRYFGNSVQFWLNLQNGYDIREERELLEKELKTIQPFTIAV
jgi:addiction module HigA family antidote